MCGIYVRIAPDPCPEKLSCPVAHRGPDAFGREDFSLEGLRVTMAHWRLAILDLKPESNQPFRRAAGGPVLVFNGEIYNFAELRGKIGGKFATTGDTEVLLAAYEKWGARCLEHLRGMFAFVVADPRRGEIFAARDRFGIKPLYYRKSGDVWEFASEIKQILPESRRANLARVRDFALYGAQDHTDETLFEGVRQLRGGECLLLSLRDGGVSLRSWYSPRRSAAFRGNFEDAVNAFRNVFFDSVALHLRSDVPVGFCLSGGMDSSALVAAGSALLRPGGCEPVAVTCHYPFAGLDECRYAQAAAGLAGARMVEVSPGDSGLTDAMEKVTYHQDEPLNNASLFSQFRVFQAARENGIKVMLDGQGADELLASYPQFFGPFLIGLLARGRVSRFLREAAHFRKDHGWQWADILRSLMMWFTPRLVFKAAKAVARPRGQFPGFRREFVMSGGVPVPPWQMPGRMHTRATTRSMSLLLIRQVSLPMLLHWEDRNSMAHSIESRVPFLDHELVEFVLSLPDTFKISDGVTKRVLKHAVRHLVPPEIVARRDKMGFATPQERWLRSDRSGQFSRLIGEAAESMPEILDRKAVLEEWGRFRNGGGNGAILWRVCALAVWRKVFGVKMS